MIEYILSFIQVGQKKGNTESARDVFFGYSSLLSYPEFNEIKEKYPDEINQIEEGLKNETLRENMIERTLSNIQKGQKKGKTEAAWCAFCDHSYLLSYLSPGKEKYSGNKPSCSSLNFLTISFTSSGVSFPFFDCS